MGAMGQAIQEGGREAFMTKDLRPFSKMEVGGDDESDFFMQGGAELKDELCAGGWEGDKAEFIQNDDLKQSGGLDELGQGMLVLGLDQFIDQAGGIEETDFVTLATGQQRQGNGHMGFS